MTIKKYERKTRRYVLEFPNERGGGAFIDFAVENYANDTPDEMESIVDALLEALAQNDMQSFFRC